MLLVLFSKEAVGAEVDFFFDPGYIIALNCVFIESSVDRAVVQDGLNTPHADSCR